MYQLPDHTTDNICSTFPIRHYLVLSYVHTKETMAIAIVDSHVVGTIYIISWGTWFDPIIFVFEIFQLRQP